MHTRLLPSLAWALAAALPSQEPADARRTPVLLVGGANNHDHAWTTPSLREILEECGRFDVTVTTEPGAFMAQPGALEPFAALVLDYNGPRWGDAAEAAFVAAVRGGTGVTVIHAANNAFPGWEEFERMVGRMWRKGTGHGRFHSFDVVVTDRYHPITAGMPDMRMHPDELYHRLVPMHGVDIRVLASAHSSRESGGTGRHEPMVMVSEFGEGRVFHTPLGHVWRGNVGNRASHFDPQFRRLVCRGTEWAATGDVTLDPMPLNFLTAQEKADGFRLLFDGRTLDGWVAYGADAPPQQGWGVRDAALTRIGPGGGDLCTAEAFADFEFRFDWRIAAGGNSGVIYHVVDGQPATYHSGLEYQVLDDANEPRDVHSAGALYDLVSPPADKPLRPAGQWNSGRIVVRGGRLEHWLNGTKIVDAPRAGAEWDKMVAGSKFKQWPVFGAAGTGRIALQEHGAEVSYRNLRIRTWP